MQVIVNHAIKEKYSDNHASQNLIRASNLTSNEAYFVFNNQIYQQLKGVPMGSPNAGVTAKWKLWIIETVVFKKLGDRLHTWLGYVNDVFAIVNVEENPNTILMN